MTAEKFFIPRELSDPSSEFTAASERLGLHWWYWNKMERKLSVSPSLLEELGYSSEEFDPSRISIYKNIHPDA